MKNEIENGKTLNEAEKQSTNFPNLLNQSERQFDYSFVPTTARIAVYDDLRSAPHIIEIQPAPTTDYIEHLSSKIYEQAKLAGGKIPYTVIREVSENFIHAQFSEVVVSILDEGNTIRFADQGPGIQQKEKAQLPGFSSAIEPMKHYIRGVGSGLPIVKDYLDLSQGTITIEDNLGTGAVVTISLAHKQPQETLTFQHIPVPPLTEREKEFIKLFAREGALGITDVTQITDYSNSTTYNTFSRLEEAGIIEKSLGKKRILTNLGFQISKAL